MRRVLTPAEREAAERETAKVHAEFAAIREARKTQGGLCMELRSKVAKAINEEAGPVGGYLRAGIAADAVLAIPEIAEALIISEKMTGDFRDYLLRRGRWEGVSADAGYV